MSGYMSIAKALTIRSEFVVPAEGPDSPHVRSV